MKKLLLMVLMVALSSTLYAQRGYGPNRSFDPNSEFGKSMQEIQDLMHNSSLTGDKTANGVFFEITATSASTVDAIKKRFVTEQDRLEAFFKNVEVSVSELDNGVKVNLESNDEQTVARLQEYGPTSIYRFIHSSVFADQSDWESAWPMGNRGSCCGNGRGYGPGMMFQDRNSDDSAPSSMNWDRDFRRNRSAMM